MTTRAVSEETGQRSEGEGDMIHKRESHWHEFWRDNGVLLFFAGIPLLLILASTIVITVALIAYLGRH